MKINFIPFKETGFFSDLVCDYIEQNQKVQNLYNRFPNLENFEAQIREKEVSFSQQNRDLLVEILDEQYANLDMSLATFKNIQALKTPKGFTITTGHQLSLFTGPLYFIYKIVSTINLARILNRKYRNYKFVPVYWMATEDHDFEEINHFFLNQKKIVWNTQQKGAVGKFLTDELFQISPILKNELGENRIVEQLINLFIDSYYKNENLASATRYLVNELFKEHGLVIIDGDNRKLKNEFTDYFRADIFKNIPFNAVSNAISEIKTIHPNYKIQVTPRQINTFYMGDSFRERIVKTEEGYAINNTEISFTERELLSELLNFPEKFSPNVLLRPVYQETILPNLAYIGGAGEIAYWLELKSLFKEMEVPFPMLILRNSFLLLQEKELIKIERTDIQLSDLFLKNADFERNFTKQLSKFSIDFTPQKEVIKQQFESLYAIAKKTDITFLNAVKAQEVKQIRGLEKLEKRLLKAEKQNYHLHLERMLSIKNKHFPNERLQERIQNFTEFYYRTNGELIDILLQNSNPLDFRFIVLSV